MKNIIILLFLLIGIKSNAQLEYILTNNEWYLQSLSIDDQVFIPPINNEMPFVNLTFEDVNSEIIFETHACNSGFGLVTIDEDNYLLSFVDGIIDITLFLCEYEENSNFENYYYGFYLNNAATPFGIGLLIIDDPDTNEDLYGLEITTPNGDRAFYHSWILSNEDFSIPKFNIYPNSVMNQFTISSGNIELMDILIYDITGKLVLTKNDIYNHNIISVDQLKSGFYFVQINDNLGNTSIKRIIKK